jgi:endogenous inhibitor of DNA gyrase (YacG/DUF329 family)
MTCLSCYRRLAPLEPVYRIRGRTPDPLGSLYDHRLSICTDCFNKAYPQPVPQWLSETRQCKGCGRPVTDYITYYNSTYCSESCRRDFYRAESKKQQLQARLTLTCAACGKSFGAKRIDSRYCSAACKQAAYRRRHSL